MSKRLKKFAGLFLSMALVLGMLTACGQDNGSTEGNSQSESKRDSTEQMSSGNQSSEETTASEEGKTLVVYYSATGTTKGVAETIADSMGADLFELVPKEPYSDADLDWTDDNSRVSKEHNDEDGRHVELEKTEVENFDSYQNIFIGYPIWWGIAAWPVDDFVKNNDFSGKTVVPFCTAMSSSIGESGELLEKMAGTGTWLDGERFTSGDSDEDIKEWVDGLKLGK